VKITDITGLLNAFGAAIEQRIEGPSCLIVFVVQNISHSQAIDVRPSHLSLVRSDVTESSKLVPRLTQCTFGICSCFDVPRGPRFGVVLRKIGNDRLTRLRQAFVL